MTNAGAINPAELARLIPFQELPEFELLLLANQAKLMQAPAGYQLFQVGARDDLEYFLLTGEVEYTAGDGTRHKIQAGSPQALRQLARLRPRQYTAVTTQPSELLVVPLDMMQALATEGAALSADGYLINELANIDDKRESQIVADFKYAVSKNQFVLPSLPEVALKVKKLIEEDEVGVDRIAQVVSADAAIAAKLIRAANSPIFFGAAGCDTPRKAIVRLGLKTTHQLIVTFAIKELFKADSNAVRDVMAKAWMDSTETAAICHVISRKIKGLPFDAEEVMLAGLLHNIGVVAALSYFLKLRPDILKDFEDTMVKLNHLHTVAGEIVLRSWNFSQEFVKVIHEVNDWQRDHQGVADMCDVVQVAKLHAMLRNHRPLPVERLDHLPAFKRLAEGDMGPRLSLQILSESDEQIRQTQQMLAG